jgi:hypothetical protein
MNPYEVRQEAERIISEDRVPTDVLQDIVDRYGEVSAEVTVRAVAEQFARTYGVDVRLIEADHGLAFQFEVDGRDLRVTVEDVTLDEERSTIYQAIE